jgi:hypothetical protein
MNQINLSLNAKKKHPRILEVLFKRKKISMNSIPKHILDDNIFYKSIKTIIY